MKKILLTLVFLLIITNHSKAAEVGEQAILSLTNLKGEKFNLEEKRGKVVIVTFWAKWCTQCRAEMPILNGLYEQYKKHGLEIIGISIDPEKQRQTVTEISEKLSYPNALFLDCKNTNFKDPNAIPVSYIIDRNGKIVDRIMSDALVPSKEDFEKVIKPLL